MLRDGVIVVYVNTSSQLKKCICPDDHIRSRTSPRKKKGYNGKGYVDLGDI
jgi:hypothetical protein